MSSSVRPPCHAAVPMAANAGRLSTGRPTRTNRAAGSKPKLNLLLLLPRGRAGTRPPGEEGGAAESRLRVAGQARQPHHRALRAPVQLEARAEGPAPEAVHEIRLTLGRGWFDEVPHDLLLHSTAAGVVRPQDKAAQPRARQAVLSSRGRHGTGSPAWPKDSGHRCFGACESARSAPLSTQRMHLQCPMHACACPTLAWAVVSSPKHALLPGTTSDASRRRNETWHARSGRGVPPPPGMVPTVSAGEVAGHCCHMAGALRRSASVWRCASSKPCHRGKSKMANRQLQQAYQGF